MHQAVVKKTRSGIFKKQDVFVFIVDILKLSLGIGNYAWFVYLFSIGNQDQILN